MIPDRDYFADKDGKLTTNASRAAIQVAVAGCFLDPRVAQHYGIGDALVSAAEPAAVRRVLKIEKPQEPQEPAAAEEPEEPKVEQPKAKRPAAKKGDKKK